MNLRVDLILESEQRSASLVSPRMALRIAAVTGPAIVLALIGLAAFSIFNLRSKVKLLEADWQLLEPRKNRAITLAERVTVNEEARAELEGWSSCHIDWNEQLSALQTAVPPNIHLSVLKIAQVLQLVDDIDPARAFSLSISGKAVGSTAEADIQTLKDRLVTAPAFTAAVETVRVPEYKADPDNKTNRLFRINCEYFTRTF